jgi:phosphate-selective porin OprO and OprP
MLSAEQIPGDAKAANTKKYSNDPERPGTFGQIKILNPVSAGGWGAWELAPG